MCIDTLEQVFSNWALQKVLRIPTKNKRELENEHARAKIVEVY